MKTLVKFLRCKKAVSAIEFAILAPWFFLIFFAIIEVGLTIFVDSTINVAVRAVAREGMTQQMTPAKADTIMRKYMQNLYKSTPGKIQLVCLEYADIAQLSAAYATISSPNLATRDAFFSQGFNCPNSSSKLAVYGIRYKWGGFTNLFNVMIGGKRPFIPDNLYSVTITRNEEF